MCSQTMKIQRLGEQQILTVRQFTGLGSVPGVTRHVNIHHESGEEREFFMLGNKYISIGDWVVDGTGEVIGDIMVKMYYKVVS